MDTGADGDPNPTMVLADLVPEGATQNLKGRFVPISGQAVYKPISQARLSGLERGKPDFIVRFTEDKNGFYINGKKYTPESGPMTTVHAGGLHHLTVVNDSHEVHPFHIHQVHFLAYSSNGIPSRPAEWLDMVNVSPGGSVDLILDFTDPIIRGMSVFHCHLLKHEDKGMMAKILFR